MEQLHAENYGDYGVRKILYPMRRRGWLMCRDHVARVMKTLGITGMKRGKQPSRPGQEQLTPIRLTMQQAVPSRSPEPTLGSRHFACLDVAVGRVCGVCHRRIPSHDCRLVRVINIEDKHVALQALNIAAWMESNCLTGMEHSSDRGSNYVPLACRELIVEPGRTSPLGSEGDSYDKRPA